MPTKRFWRIPIIPSSTTRSRIRFQRGTVFKIVPAMPLGRWRQPFSATLNCPGRISSAEQVRGPRRSASLAAHSLDQFATRWRARSLTVVEALAQRLRYLLLSGGGGKGTRQGSASTGWRRSVLWPGQQDTGYPRRGGGLVPAWKRQTGDVDDEELHFCDRTRGTCWLPPFDAATAGGGG